MTERGIELRLETALACARAAQDFVLPFFEAAVTGTGRFEDKADGTPVTDADRGAEALIRERIGREWPADGIVGEEHGEVEGTTGFRWVIDPIDGTKSFIHGVPLFGTLIGIQQRTAADDPAAAEAVDGWRSVAGVARFPALDECVWAARGRGAWHATARSDRPRRARVSEVRRLEDAAASATSIRTLLDPPNDRAYLALCRRTRLMRGWSDCYGMLLVATGRLEVMIDPPMRVWDVAALEPILAEAGGRLTGWDGRPTAGPTGAIASNGWVHDEVLRLGWRVPGVRDPRPGA